MADAKEYIIIDTKYSTNDLELVQSIDYESYDRKNDELTLTVDQLKDICRAMYERGRLEN